MATNQIMGEDTDSDPRTTANPSTSAMNDSPEDMLTEFNPKAAPRTASRPISTSCVPAVVVVEGPAG